MKQNKRFFFTTLVLLAAYVLSACGGLPQQADQSSGDQAAIKVRAVEVAYTGVIDAISGTEWTVNGQVLSVDPSVVRDGPFQAGDTVKVEGEVNQDGSITVKRVEAPSPADLTDLPQLGDDNANINDNTNDDNSNENTNDNTNVNGNDNDDDDDDNANGNSNDDDDDDDSNSNGNSNDDDYDDDSNSNSNSNNNSNDDDDDDHGSGGSGGNSNGNHDDDDDDHSGNSNDDDDD